MTGNIPVPSAIHIAVEKFDQFLMPFTDLNTPETILGHSLTLDAFYKSDVFLKVQWRLFLATLQELHLF